MRDASRMLIFHLPEACSGSELPGFLPGGYSEIELPGFIRTFMTDSNSSRAL